VKRPYETIIVFDGTLPDEVVQKEQKAIEDIISQNATLERIDSWGKRQLAYNIKKKKTGVYIVFNFEGEGNVVIALEKHFKLNENILRHLTCVRNVKNDIARAAVANRKERPVIDADDDSDMDD
jgi:small subunit ribosomal protein S6